MERKRQGVVIGGNIDQHDCGIGTLNAAQNRVGGNHRISGAGMHDSRHAGAVDQHLQHRPLLVILGDDYDWKLGHGPSGPLQIILTTRYIRAHELRPAVSGLGIHFLSPDGFLPSNLSLSMNG